MPDSKCAWVTTVDQTCHQPVAGLLVVGGNSRPLLLDCNVVKLTSGLCFVDLPLCLPVLSVEWACYLHCCSNNCPKWADGWAHGCLWS